MRKLGSKSVGNDESCYMHVIRFYMPKIAWETYQKHKCGIGIFTMQGCERRNKESTYPSSGLYSGNSGVLGRTGTRSAVEFLILQNLEYKGL